MNDQYKKVNNPLFHASVTGGTFEEFSQNVLLLPAEEKPPAPLIKLSPEQLLNDIIPDSKPPQENDPIQDLVSNPSQQEPLNLPDATSIQPHLAASQPTVNISSVFSSFTNILNIRNTNTAKEEFVAPLPAGIDSFIGQENSNPEPVPLFPANSTPILQPSAPPCTTAPSNTFRRTGLKRPTYAPIPGLSSSSQTAPIQHTIQPPALPPAQPNYFIPKNPSVSPANSVSSNVSGKDVIYNPNQFKPISPPPTPLNTGYTVAQPKPLGQYPIVQNQPPSHFPPIQHQAQFVPIHPEPSSQVTFFQTQPLDQVASPQLQSLNSFPISQSPLINTGLSHPQSIGDFPLPTSKPATGFHQNQQLLVPAASQKLLGPVMSAMPASELLQNPTLNVATSATMSRTDNPLENNDFVKQTYRPVYHHWFYQKDNENKTFWQPFSMVDSLALEHAFTSNDVDPEKVIATDGGRYDVNILRRQRIPIYWKGEPTEVKRCSWFHKDSPNGGLIPYEENVATKLEEEYKLSFELNQWHRNVKLANGETVVLHGPDVLVLFPRSQSPDAWGTTPNQTRPRVVKRGMDEFDIDEGESSDVDHILFMVHGIGSVCDLKFKPVEETVDEFRNIALQLVRSHYRSSCETGKINRVEILPIGWHVHLHSEETGIDQQLKNITLESIPKLRDFTNDTLLDVLFYTSPRYCQTVVAAVGNELNRIYDLYKQRNPNFNGGISIGGHSLGSLIIFDLLCHQVPNTENEEEQILEDPSDDDLVTQQSKPPPVKRTMSRRISYMMGSTGTGQPQIHYPHLNFHPKMFFALGSPIGMFVIIRGLERLGQNFSLPTCPAFYNIFHPYDPIAYRMEALINPDLGKLKPVLIPHHKGRKRMHLELKETMARVGADLKQKVVDSIRSTWDSFYQLAMFHKPGEVSLEEEVQKAFDEKLENTEEVVEEPSKALPTGALGHLNEGRRIDYVLQEAPLEFINEYIFAITSHVCYWESEDTILMILKEIYSTMEVTPDSQLPQQTMTIERPPPSPTSLRSSKLNTVLQKSQAVCIDPTRPIVNNSNLQRPPVIGLVKKT